jgi:predicted transcriptional regulator
MYHQSPASVQWRPGFFVPSRRGENTSAHIGQAERGADNDSRLYEFAATLLYNVNWLPTSENLPEFVGVTEEEVRQVMARDSELAKRINYSSPSESVVFHTGRKIRFSGEKVTVTKIAAESGLHRQTVLAVLRKRREFARFLALDEVREKKPRARKESESGIMTHLKNARKLPQKTLFTRSDALEVRIVCILSLRYGYSMDELLSRVGRGEKRDFCQVRYLAMYLLVEDAGRTHGEVAQLLGDTAVKTVGVGLRTIRKYYIERANVRKEIQILRNHYRIG